MNLLKDCGIFVARSMGEKSLLEISSCKIDCIITSIEEIHTAISYYIDRQLEGFKYYDADAKDLITCSQKKYV